MSNNSLRLLVDSMGEKDKEAFEDIGRRVGKLYTDHGFPLDMALDRICGTKQQKILVLLGACQWFIEHKRQSGATEKALSRQRATNQKILDEFINHNEIGIY